MVELMDQPGLDPVEHGRALDGLRRINRLSRTGAVLWRPIASLARSVQGSKTTLQVLDLATGGGAAPLSLARRAARSGLDVSFDGCDISPQAVEFAQRQARSSGLCGRFFVHDALTETLPINYDIVICSLFLHHLSEPDAIRLLSRMGQAARRLVLVDDLVRSRRGYALAQLGCRLLSRSRIVHVDGPRSVAAAFTPAEALDLAARAGLRGAAVSRHWPQRFLLSWSPT